MRLSNPNFSISLCVEGCWKIIETMTQKETANLIFLAISGRRKIIPGHAIYGSNYKAIAKRKPPSIFSLNVVLDSSPRNVKSE